MSLPLPRSLSPSKVSAFCSCPLAFRFSVIDRIPEPPSQAMVKGTLVHRALERLYWYHDRGGRSRAVAITELDRAWDELQSDEEYLSLGQSESEAMEFLEDAAKLVGNYFDLEDPDSMRTIGVELMLEADLDGMLLRGIIDRLDVEDVGRACRGRLQDRAVPPAKPASRGASAASTLTRCCARKSLDDFPRA